MNISQPTLRSGEHQKQCYTLIPSPWVQAEHIRYWHICEGKPHNQLIWNLNVDLEWVKGWVVMQVTGLLYELYICNRRYSRNVLLLYYNHPPSVGSIYPLSIYIFHQDIFSRIVGMIYTILTKASNCVKCSKLFDFISIRISKCISPSPRPKGAQKLSNLHSSPNSWHDISNTNIYSPQTNTP